MTSICLKSKSSAKTDIWSSTSTNFHSEIVSSCFMKKLTTTCISTVLYLRNILPDEYFESKMFEGVSLKILKEGRDQNYAGRIQQWLEGAFEAIDKKYLKNLMLDIQDAETNKALEIYKMSFNYKQGNEALNFLLSTTESNKKCGFAKSNIKLNTINLLQICSAVTRTSGNLPSQISLAMRLSYYENTPEDYQPRGYTSWEPQDLIFSKETRSIKIGVIETPHHYFKFVNKSCLNEEFFKGLENAEYLSSAYCKVHQTCNRQRNSQSKQRLTKVKRELCFEKSQCTDSQNRTPSPIFQMQKTNLSQASTCYKNHPDKRAPEYLPQKRMDDAAKKSLRRDFRKLKTRCVCLSAEKSRTVISCLACKNLVHAECFGILQQEILENLKFYCHLCHQPERKFNCHDKVLLGLKSSSDQQKLAILRKILRYCTRNYILKISLKQMKKTAGSGCQISVVEIILKKMVEIGVAIPQKKRMTYLLNKEELSKQLGYYFYSDQNNKFI